VTTLMSLGEDKRKHFCSNSKRNKIKEFLLFSQMRPPIEMYRQFCCILTNVQLSDDLVR
jgi:hypothetical protein